MAFFIKTTTTTPEISNTDSQESLKKVSGTWKLYISAGAALFGAVGMGMVLGYTSPAIPLMKKTGNRFSVSDEDVSWFESVMALGGLIGGLLAGICTEKIGRRSMLVFCALPFIAGWLLIAYAPNTAILFAGRLLTGISCGIITGTSPMYVIEIATPKIRGFLGAFFQLAVAIGILLTTIVGTVLPHWRWLAVICSAPAVVMMIGMTLAPETPQWLLSKGKHNEAVHAATSLYGKGDSMSTQMVNIVGSGRCDQKLEMSDFKQRSLYMPTLFSIVLLFVQQFCGINPISFNTVEIFTLAGTATMFSANIATILFNCAQISGNFASAVLMDKLGRRILLATSGFLMGISLGSFGFYYYFLEQGSADFKISYSWIPLVCLIVFVIAFAIGFGPIPWIMMSEMVPQRARGFVNGIGSSFQWACGFVVTKFFDTMNKNIHPAGTYWTYCLISILGAIFGWICIPETKGKTFAEIERFFKKEKPKLGSLDQAAIINDVVVQK